MILLKKNENQSIFAFNKLSFNAWHVIFKMMSVYKGPLEMLILPTYYASYLAPLPKLFLLSLSCGNGYPFFYCSYGFCPFSKNLLTIRTITSPIFSTATLLVRHIRRQVETIEIIFLTVDYRFGLFWVYFLINNKKA